MSEPASSVAFHTGVTDPVQHVLRLVRKAVSLGSRVLVLGPAQPLHELDEQLWTADPGSFLPHGLWTPQAHGSTRLSRAAVWLCTQADACLQANDSATLPDVLINLGTPSAQADGAAAVCAAGVRFSKVIELVPQDPAARASGQRRWRAWREQGVVPVHHTFS